jgi:uncharacterized membrane protein HdeD (DUF308 family)
MNSSSAGAGLPDTGLRQPTWVRLLLGMVLILGGIVILGDVALATVVSPLFIGAIAIGVGAFEIVHALWSRGWGGFGIQVILGALYLACGAALVSQPVLPTLTMTFLVGLVLVLSGLVRILIGVSHWQELGRIMFVPGVFGILGGLVILTGFPKAGLWILGLLLGFDLLVHGIAWLTYGLRPTLRHERSQSPTGAP